MLRPAHYLAPLLLISGAATAAPGGSLGTLPRGYYVCETGGDAMGATGILQPQFDFSIKRASTYTTATGAGVYLKTGDRVVFTSGPHEGIKLRHIRNGFVRRTNADGTDSDLRCIRKPGSNFYIQP